jgi:pyridoxal phosphate enzyme (YggS family)
MTRADELASALEAVRARIATAERAAGRAAGSVRLVAVSKKMPVDDLRAVLAAGQLDLGESYGQELRDKREAFAAAPPAAPPRWHFIGPLQANKVKYVAGLVALVHSVDSAELLDELDRRASGASGASGEQACLIQVNVAGEARKRGVAPDALPALLDHVGTLARVRCEGLMTIPPLEGDPRPHFAALRALRDREAARARPHVALRELSMGMSHDLEAAVAEGATLVRVGTAIFGAR